MTLLCPCGTTFNVVATPSGLPLVCDECVGYLTFNPSLAPCWSGRYVVELEGAS